MKQILRTTAGEMRRILCSTGFWLSVGLTVIILMTSTMYKETDGTTYSLFTLGMHFDKLQLQNFGIFAQRDFSTLVLYTLPMYGPLLAALSFGTSLCEEQKYGVRRYVLFKEGKLPYVLSKAISAICASGLAFLIGAGIILLFMYWRYPLMSTMDTASYQMWMEHYFADADGITKLLFSWFGEHAFSILVLFGVVLYGVFCGFIGYICTAFFSNVYLAVCIPFFFGYVYYSITQALMARMTEGAVSIEVYNAINSYVSPEGYMAFWRQKESFGVNMMVLLAVWIMAIVIQLVRLQKAADCGVK